MNTSDIVKNIAFGNYEIAKNAINHILLTKTSIALDEKKKEVATNIYCEECNMNEEKDSDRYSDGDPKAEDRGDKEESKNSERGRRTRGDGKRSDEDNAAAAKARKKRIAGYRKKASKGKPIF